MKRMKFSLKESEFWLCELRYYGMLAGWIMFVPMVLGILFMCLPDSYATDNWDIEGANGVIYLHGSVTESACRLEMASASQDIRLDDVSTARLQHVGDRGAPVKVELRLADCLRIAGGIRDMRTGTMTWDHIQPAATVSFRATRDADNAQLIKARGVSGLGLRLEDSRGQDVRLGERGSPLLLATGQNILSYIVTPERTSADLIAGSYQAVVDFHLNYD